jgi:hypothetical protein
MLEHHAGIDQHAYRDEKDAREKIAKGEEVTQGLVAIFRFRDNETGEKCSQSE